MIAMRWMDARFLVCCSLIIFAVITRLLPHPVNVAPITAIGLFSGAYLGARYAWLVPITALLISDIFIGFYAPLSMFFVYLGFVMSALIGRALLLKSHTVTQIAMATLIGSSIFFFLSNLGVWLLGQLYPMTMSGLIDCYVMAIPFFKNSLLGDIAYVALLFGLYQAICVGFKLDTQSA